MSWNAFCLALIPALLLLGTGCGGIRGSGSISPASFLLPGLLQNEDKAAEAAPLASHPPTDTVPTAQSL